MPVGAVDKVVSVARWKHSPATQEVPSVTCIVSAGNVSTVPEPVATLLSPTVASPRYTTTATSVALVQVPDVSVVVSAILYPQAEPAELEVFVSSGVMSAGTVGVLFDPSRNAQNKSKSPTWCAGTVTEVPSALSAAILAIAILQEWLRNRKSSRD